MQTENQIKADAINEFVCHMIAALDAGFVDTPNLNLATVHRVAQNFVLDRYGIELPHIAEQWGDDTARLCGYLPLNKDNQQSE